MCDLIRHRGPDDEGYAFFTDNGVSTFGGLDTPEGLLAGDHAYAPRALLGAGTSSEARVALGHRRLAIVDLSPMGHQPLCEPSQRYWIVFNGEIYNHPELAKELNDLGHPVAAGSDTAVLVAAFALWGVEALQRLEGMFAFVLYDRREDRIIAGRDRFGVKPLYWWRLPDGSLAFASEIKQFAALPSWRARIEGQRAYDYLNWGLTDHTAETMFAGVGQVPPGHLLDFAVRDLASAGDIAPRRWFTLQLDDQALSADEAAARFRVLFLNSIDLRLRADVPVGAALSGGLDSSSVVCAARHRFGPAAALQTFSARSHEAQFDEGDYIDSVLAATKASPHMTWPQADELLDDMQRLVWHQDEPFGSTSIYAEWCVYRSVAAAGVKVTLDGHGADEILGGYVAALGPFLGGLLRQGKLGDFGRELAAQRRLHRRPWVFLLGSIMDDLAPKGARTILRRAGGRTADQVDWIDCGRLGATPANPMETNGAFGGGLRGFGLSQLTATSLPMQLKWTDRNSMAHGVESREPFLHSPLVAMTLAQPERYKIRGGLSKRLLRDALKDLLPPKILNRRDKMGFVTPEQTWLMRDRPEVFRQALRNAVARSEGILTPRALAVGDAILDGGAPYHSRLWRMICFGQWLERFEVEVAR